MAGGTDYLKAIHESVESLRKETKDDLKALSDKVDGLATLDKRVTVIENDIKKVGLLLLGGIPLLWDWIKRHVGAA